MLDLFSVDEICFELLAFATGKVFWLWAYAGFCDIFGFEWLRF